MVSSAAVTGLSNNTQYFYCLEGYNAAGQSGNSNTISVTTLVIPVVPPSAPTATAATNIQQYSFSANWNVSSQATDYHVDVATDAGFTSILPNYNNVDGGNVPTLPIYGLSPGTQYHYRVRASNSGGTSGNSGTIDVTTADTVASIPVADLPTSITTSGFIANWEPFTGATSYRLDVSANPTFVFTDTSWCYQNLDVGLLTSFPVAGLAHSTTYYYCVRAVTPSGTTISSNIETVTTLGITPTGTYKRSIILQAKP
jgi:phosphodiesterase/alkaline phosphatase D-like protein